MANVVTTTLQRQIGDNIIIQETPNTATSDKEEVMSNIVDQEDLLEEAGVVGHIQQPGRFAEDSNSQSTIVV
jgi:hypothetical protein